MNDSTATSFRKWANAFLWLGAIGSLVLVLYHGRQNSSIVLISLFAVCVVSPYVGFWLADKRAVFWSNDLQIALYCLIIMYSTTSLFFYNPISHFPGTKPAFFFLLTPLIGWLLILLLLILSRKSSPGIHG